MAKKLNWNVILLTALVVFLVIVLLNKLLGRTSPLYQIVCESGEAYSVPDYTKAPRAPFVPVPQKPTQNPHLIASAGANIVYTKAPRAPFVPVPQKPTQNPHLIASAGANIVYTKAPRR